jgi:hypothetical protein
MTGIHRAALDNFTALIPDRLDFIIDFDPLVPVK